MTSSLGTVHGLPTSIKPCNANASPLPPLSLSLSLPSKLPWPVPISLRGDSFLFRPSRQDKRSLFSSHRRAASWWDDLCLSYRSDAGPKRRSHHLFQTSPMTDRPQYPIIGLQSLCKSLQRVTTLHDRWSVLYCTPNSFLHVTYIRFVLSQIYSNLIKFIQNITIFIY